MLAEKALQIGHSASERRSERGAFLRRQPGPLVEGGEFLPQRIPPMSIGLERFEQHVPRPTMAQRVPKIRSSRAKTRKVRSGRWGPGRESLDHLVGAQ